MEFPGILRHATGVAPAEFARRLVALRPGSAITNFCWRPTEWARARAAAAVDAALQSFRPEAIVSTGFCGALDPAWRSPM